MSSLTIECTELSAQSNAHHKKYDVSTVPMLHLSPLLLLRRKMIELAFIDAAETSHGQPTQTALEAEAWLRARTDWSRTGEIPDPTIRREYFGSFEWCCSYLSLDPDKVREHGLPRPVALWRKGNKVRGLHVIPSRFTSRGTRHVAGLPEVVERRARAAQR